MIRKLQLVPLLPVCIALQFAALWSGVAAFGEPISGDIRGVTRAPSGAPLAEVQVTARSLDENIARTVVSDGDGGFLVENLQPGRYQLTARKKGFATSPVTSVQLEAQQSLHVDVILARLDGSEGAKDLTPPPAAQNSDSAPLTEREKQLLDRIDRLEQRLAALEAKDASQTAVATKTAPGAEPLLASANAAGRFTTT